jgi:mono/diheme cytochrome c family protein
MRETVPPLAGVVTPLIQERQIMKNVLKASLLALAIALIFSTYTFADAGGDTFKAKCAACHGATGAGDTTMGKNLKLRDMGSADVQKQSDDELATIVTKGKGKMPAYDGKLTKEQIGEVVKFIRSLKK